MDEYLSSIKQCFQLFFDTVKDKISKNKMVSLHIDSKGISEITLEEISADANVLYMGYVVSSAYSISSDSYICIAYNQLMSMINEFSNIYQRNLTLEILKDENRALKKECLKLKEENERLLAEKENKGSENGKGEKKEDKKAGWFA